MPFLRHATVTATRCQPGALDGIIILVIEPRKRFGGNKEGEDSFGGRSFLHHKGQEGKVPLCTKIISQFVHGLLMFRRIHFSDIQKLPFNGRQIFNPFKFEEIPFGVALLH